MDARVCLRVYALLCVSACYYLGYLSMIRSANKHVSVHIWIDPIVGTFSYRFIFATAFEAA